MKCTFCGQTVPIDGRVRRDETCTGCGRELRCCRQCEFYDPDAYNSCREVAAERIVDKERSNFCDYFVPSGSGQGSFNKAVDAKKKLEALFKK